MRGSYATVKILLEIAKIIDRVVEETRLWQSRADFIDEAVREKLRSMGKL